VTVEVDRPRRSRGRLASYLGAGSVYLLASVGLWWHAWSATPSTVMTCDCTDAGRTMWYFEWSAYALRHGHQLLFSNWVFHPVGLNLLADTSVPALALLMAPVTLLAGPVTAVNVASTLIPAVTALSMFWLLRRWVQWAPAAFVGGLAYGFSAVVIVQLAFGWLNLACLALLPLIVGCFDELLIRQRHRPARVGGALALLMTTEFFVSTEMVLIVSVSALVAVLIVVAYGSVVDSQELRRRARHGFTGMAVAVAGTALLLAYPLWFFVDGPAHLSGMVWSTNVPGDLGNVVGNFWSHLGRWGPLTSSQLAQEAPVFGGYGGPAFPSPSYLGPGLLGVVLVGMAVWRSDRRLWFFASLGVLTAALSLRATRGGWVPWSLVVHQPIFENVVQSRFAAVFDLCAAAALSIVVDRARAAVSVWSARRRPTSAPAHHRRSAVSGRVVPAVVALAVSAVALVPVAASMSPNLPLVLQPVTVPHWFSTTATTLSPTDVLLTYPFATADSQSPLVWQAIGAMHFRMAGGGGPAGTPARAGDNALAFRMLSRASVPLGPAPAPSLVTLDAVRTAIRRWGVTLVVVPDDRGLPRFQTGRGTSFGVAFFTAILGTAPRRQNRAWVWSNLTRLPPPTPLSTAAFTACVTPSTSPLSGGDPWARCVLRTAPRSQGLG
jgi:hypothetical protein